MLQSTLTDRFQTTIPLEVRQALNLVPRQRIAYEVRSDGSVLLRPVPHLDSLFGSLKPVRPVEATQSGKKAAREAMSMQVARYEPRA
jgi:bifunctional DNA-binding transcriptional regulator/antitoxin component of YhaV-PrlF toxin-antitoxin module